MKKFFIPIMLLIFCLAVISTHNVTVEATAACAHPTLGEQYCEATHPHEYYRQCKSCGEKVYTGGTATKNHGTGEWGSGTCPSCGTHTFVWSDCTTPGTCACGATTEAKGHAGAGSIMLEAVHPHRYYQICQVCNGKAYTGYKSTYQHGDGTNGTCESCGSHTYITKIYPQPVGWAGDHPHESIYACVCGATKTSYPLQQACAQCSANSTTGSQSASKPVSQLYVDGDQGIYFPIFANFTLTITYRNTYNCPADNDIMQLYDFPQFASFGSSVMLTAKGMAAGTPPVYTYANQNVTYYGGGSSWVQTLTVQMPNPDTLNMAGFFFTYFRFPSYATANGACNLDGTTQSDAISVSLNFYR